MNQNVPNKELEKFTTVGELIQCHTKKATKIATVAVVMISEPSVPSRHEQRPFGIPIKEKRTHSRIAPGDIIQISNDFYMVNEVGVSQIEIRT